jgi:hypothetical protein
MNSNDNSSSRSQPPVWFDLSEIDPNQALIDIRRFTNNFSSLKDTEFMEKFDESINRHFGYKNRPVIVGYIPAPPNTNKKNIDVVKKVIGSSGYWLKKTTEDCDVHFIWYDIGLNNFLFWGPTRKATSRAMKAIRRRITKYYEYFCDGKTELPNDNVNVNDKNKCNDDNLSIMPALKKLRLTYNRDFDLYVYNPADDQPDSLEGYISCPSDKCFIPITEDKHTEDKHTEDKHTEDKHTEAEKYGCKCNGDTGICCMACWRNADA